MHVYSVSASPISMIYTHRPQRVQPQLLQQYHPTFKAPSREVNRSICMYLVVPSCVWLALIDRWMDGWMDRSAHTYMCTIYIWTAIRLVSRLHEKRRLDRRRRSGRRRRGCAFTGTGRSGATGSRSSARRQVNIHVFVHTHVVVLTLTLIYIYVCIHPQKTNCTRPA